MPTSTPAYAMHCSALGKREKSPNSPNIVAQLIGPFKRVVPIFACAAIVFTILATVSYIVDGVINNRFNFVGLVVNILLVALSITLLVCSIVLTKYYGTKLKNSTKVVEELQNKSKQ